MTVLLVSHAVTGVVAAGTDLVYPFSGSKAVAEFIQRRGLTDAVTIGSKYNVVSAVAGYLDQPVYYAENKQRGTFVAWNRRRSPVTPAELVRTARELARTDRKDVLLITSYDLGSEGRELAELGSFQRSIVRHERYWRVSQALSRGELAAPGWITGRVGSRGKMIS